MKRLSRVSTAVTALVLLTGLGLSGCSAASSGDYSLPEYGDSVVESGGDAGAPVASDSVQEQSFVTTGYMTVTADEPLAAAVDAIRIVESVGGRVDSRQEYAPAGGDQGSATLTLRIPSSALTSTIAKLKKLGEVVEVNTSSQNVTGQVTDLEARITAKRASVDRLTELLNTATSTEKLITIESSLSERQESLEQLESQQRSLADQVSLSTITLNLVSVAAAPPAVKPATFLTGLEAGWGSFVAFISGLVVVFGVLLPWLVFFALLASGVVLLVRWRARWYRAHTPAPVTAAEAAAAAPAPPVAEN